MATSALDGVVGQERGGGSSTANSWNRGRDFFFQACRQGCSGLTQERREGRTEYFWLERREGNEHRSPDQMAWLPNY